MGIGCPLEGGRHRPARSETFHRAGPTADLESRRFGQRTKSAERAAVARGIFARRHELERSAAHSGKRGLAVAPHLAEWGRLWDRLQVGHSATRTKIQCS